MALEWELIGLIYLFICGATASDALGLFLALHSGIKPGSTQGVIWDIRDGAWVGCIQGSAQITGSGSATRNISW